MRLQTKILLVVTPLVVLPLLWLGWTAYTKLKQYSAEAALGQMTTLLEQVGLHATQHLDTAQSNIKLFAGSGLVRKYVLTEDLAERYTLLQPPLMRLFASYQRAYPDYYELRILLPDGYEDARFTLTSLANATEEEGEAEFLQHLIQTGQEAHAHYAFNPDNGQPGLYVTRRLVFRDESFEDSSIPPRLRGYLVVTASLDFLGAQITSHRIGKNGFLFLTNASGQLLFRPEGKIPSGRLSQAQLKRLTRLARGAGHIELNFENRKSYVQGRRLHDELYLFAVLPEADVLAAGRGLGIVVAMITVLAIVLTTGLILVTISRILIRPIQQLGNAARDIGRGRFTAKTDIRSHDELGELADSFEEMGRNLQESQDQVTYLAYHDPLTGLPNRRMLHEYLSRSLAQAKRRGEKLALLFFDLDNFKRVNDSLGHHAGDQLLQELAERLLEYLREEDLVARNNRHKPSRSGEEPVDTVARVGGDEFVVLLPRIYNPSEAAAVAQRIIGMLSSPFRIKGDEFFISASVGVTLFPDDGEDADTLIKNADIAMYHAKEKGRDNYQFFDESMNTVAFERITLENALRRAIEREEFVLHYQPKVDLRSGKIRSVEALIRWQHPEIGLIPPDKFIALAEDTGLIVPIGEWVLDQACAQAAAWRRDGMELPVSVNISTVQLDKQDVASIIQATLDRSGCPAVLLEIELTETSIMDARKRSLSLLDDIKYQGVRISMDDFGIGYSSFRYLRELPVDVLKIDRDFVR
ncbi:MAG: EAL domain-containing protein, partial [Gammaproteobacteria bacterium]|nr:EAL domain-containing protein [Gammaproteobacteria bacterium]